ncbi:MAG: PepSY domain-containing protein [Methylovulum sp.]|nr:PepSY domain-containing protein [Methylovulum sp.]
MKKLKRLLFEVHRWVGIALAAFMLMWFFSGLMIMYAPTITQTRTQQLAHAETLAPAMSWLSLGAAWERSAEQRKALAKPKAKEAKDDDVATSIMDARLVRSADEPLWLIEDSKGQRYALSALDGLLHNTSVDQALKIAEHWHEASTGGDIVQASHLATIDKTIMLRNQDALAPFYQIGVGHDGEQLLISSRTGEVLHASTRIGRAFYWAGNWLHLFKPLEAVGLGHIRTEVQMYSGLSATLATMTGLIIGWLRWRPGFGGRATYSQGRTQPYREFWYKWHFWSGLLGGTVMLFWAFSGFLDTNPGKIFSQTNPNRQDINLYIGNGLPVAMRDWQPVLPLELAAAVDGADVVELSWKRLENQAVLLAHTRDGQRLPQAVEGANAGFDAPSLLAAVGRIAGKTAVASQVLLHDYDSYYYARPDQGLVEKPLPVLVVTLADAAGTRVYVDPQDGKLLAKVDRSARILRWAYSALHHWDFGWLKYRPLWDVWMVTWVLFGLVLSVSSGVIGWKRLKLTFAVKKTSSRKARYPNKPAIEESAG